MVAFYDGLMFFIILFIGMIPAIVLQIQGNRISNYILVFTIFIIYLALRSEPIQMVYLEGIHISFTILFYLLYCRYFLQNVVHFGVIIGLLL